MKLDLQMIGKRIKQARNNKNITQAKLAELLGVSTAYIGQLERAITNLTLENLLKLSEILDVPVTYFIQDSITPPKATSIDEEIQNALSNMSQRQKEHISKVIRDFNSFCKDLIDGILK